MRTVIVLAILQYLIGLTFLGAVVAIAWHFIQKFW